jgi:integrating conjugative element membrane protein (TIGR03747 family)
MAQSATGNRSIGLLGSLLWQLFSLIGWLILSVLLALLIAMLLLFFLGKEVGLTYLLHLWQVHCQWTIDRLNETNAHQQLVLSWLVWLQVGVTDLREKLNTIAIEDSIHANNIMFISFFKFVKSAFSFVGAYLQSLIIMLAVILMRLLDVGLFFPLFALFSVMGLLDGLIQRDLRRFHGLRESAFRYHFARRALMPCLKWGLLLYIAFPLEIYPDYFLLPVAVLFSVCVASSAKQFKKYV